MRVQARRRRLRGADRAETVRDDLANNWKFNRKRVDIPSAQGAISGVSAAVTRWPSGHMNGVNHLFPKNGSSRAAASHGMIFDLSRASDQKVQTILKGAHAMGDHVYKIIELTGSSSDGIEQAVQNAVTRAGKTLENLRWLEIINTRAQIVDNAIAHWQVTIKVGFTLNEPNTL